MFNENLFALPAPFPQKSPLLLNDSFSSLAFSLRLLGRSHQSIARSKCEAADLPNLSHMKTDATTGELNILTYSHRFVWSKTKTGLTHHLPKPSDPCTRRQRLDSSVHQSLGIWSASFWSFATMGSQDHPETHVLHFMCSNIMSLLLLLSRDAVYHWCSLLNFGCSRFHSRMFLKGITLQAWDISYSLFI